MALDFTGDATDRVEIAAADSIDDLTAFSHWQWINLDASADNRRAWSKNGDAGSQLVLNASEAIGVEIQRATTDAVIVTPTGQFSTGEWTCICFTYDETDGPRVFTGNLTTALTEVSYTTRTVGAGSTNADNAGPLNIGNRASGDAKSPDGRIAIHRLFNTRKTLAQLQAQQFRPYPTSDLVLYQILGFNGVGTQPDYSGNGNSGTVTGATQADHVPLGPPFGFDAPVVFAAAAAAAGAISDFRFRQRYLG